MQALYVLLLLVSIICLFVGLSFLLFPSKRKKGKWLTTLSVTGVVSSFIIFSIFQNDFAVEDGFLSSDDQRQARAHGFTKAVEWAAVRQKIAGEDARAKARSVEEAGMGEVKKRQQAESEQVKKAAISTAEPARESPSDLSYRSARALCAGFKATGLLREECKVSVWYQTVEITMDVSSAAADLACTKGVETARSGLKFQPGWQLKVYSPYSGDRTIAICDLS